MAVHSHKITQLFQTVAKIFRLAVHCPHSIRTMQVANFAPYKILGQCLNPMCFQPICTHYESGPDAFPGDCKFCYCSSHHHQFLGVFAGNQLFDVSKIPIRNRRERVEIGVETPDNKRKAEPRTPSAFGSARKFLKTNEGAQTPYARTGTSSTATINLTGNGSDSDATEHLDSDK